MAWHEVLAGDPLIIGFADRRAKIEAGRLAYAEERHQLQSAYGAAYTTWRQEATAAIAEGRPVPPEPKPPEQLGQNLDGDFWAALAQVDDEQQKMIAGRRLEFEGRAREHEARQIDAAMKLPVPQWGEILADLSSLCATIRHVRHTAAMVRAGGAAAPRFSTDPKTGLAVVEQVTGDFAVTRETVDEVDLIEAWKHQWSLLDPVTEHTGEPVRISDLRVQRPAAVPKPAQPPRQYGTSRGA
jgi:hypothetical protein